MQDDSEIVASYIPLVSFLGEVVGRNTEVVLHDLVDIDASVVAIVNGEVSGRTVGSPATDLVLRELEEDSGEQVPYRVHYTARAGGRTLASSSFFIRRDGRLIGMLCVNTDHTLMRRLESLVAEVSGLFPGAAVDAGAPVSRETLVSSIDGMAAEVIDDVARQRARGQGGRGARNGCCRGHGKIIASMTPASGARLDTPWCVTARADRVAIEIACVWEETDKRVE